MTTEGGAEQETTSTAGLIGLSCLAVLLVVAFVTFKGLLTPEHDRAVTASGAETPPARVAPALPTRLVIPAIDLRAPVIPIEMTPEGVLYPPDDVDVVGWWQRSAKPGAGTGQTVLTGHTVSKGEGVMDDLGALDRGDRVRVRTSSGTLVYETTRVADYSREEVAARAHRLFGQQREEGRLVLVTCTDWDGEVYQSNTIVFARRLTSDIAR